MSTTSSLYAEIWKHNQWEPIPKPKWSKGKQVPVCYMRPGGMYELFSALVGYHHHSLCYLHWHTEKIVPLSEPRGLPKDMNTVYREHFENNSLGIEHHFTWFLVQEVIEYDWDRKFPPCTGYVNSRYASLFQNSAPFPQDLPDDEPVYKNKKENTTEVLWVDTYRYYVGCVDWFIEELLKLGNPEEVRILFWLH
ncbi:hypothetical protein [Calothrix sp. NIES-2098]|uniref:hypothetical protein n=1 Tax=Calothrix sp. NIES-2098 TaxID=1954171 RepID=UPI000B61F3CD|nr:hypothetical protein NIES2098_58830 [Calothrix sp. NIES-2098]